MIDICDFAVGLSRQLHGLTIASERPGHRLMETWHPMGPCAVITAFNFPVAVWSWNAALALVCGDPVVWKPSEKTPLTALACDALFQQAAAEVGAPGRAQPGAAGRRRRRRGAGRAPRRADRVGHRLDPHGPRRRAGRRRPLRPADPRARRQQRGDRRADRRPRPRRPRHRLLGRRHRRPALHQPAPAHRPRVGPRRARRASGQGLRQRADRRPARRRHPGRPADRRRRVRRHAGGARHGDGSDGGARRRRRRPGARRRGRRTRSTPRRRSSTMPARPTSCAPRRSRRSST